MPLVRIDLRQGVSTDYKKAIADGVHQALVETINVPNDDRFQVITEHLPENLIYDPAYMGIQRTNHVVFVQVTISVGRSLELKRNLYKRMAEILAAKPGLRPQDLFINVVEVGKENWSFGDGVAQYAE